MFEAELMRSYFGLAVVEAELEEVELKEVRKQLLQSELAMV